MEITTTVDAKKPSDSRLSVQAAYITEAVGHIRMPKCWSLRNVKALAEHQKEFHHEIEIPQEQFIQRLPEMRKALKIMTTIPWQPNPTLLVTL